MTITTDIDHYRKFLRKCGYHVPGTNTPARIAETPAPSGISVEASVGMSGDRQIHSGEYCRENNQHDKNLVRYMDINREKNVTSFGPARRDSPKVHRTLLQFHPRLLAASYLAIELGYCCSSTSLSRVTMHSTCRNQ